MKIAYVLMQFPVASETFASNDVKYLNDNGHSVTVFCMRPKNTSQERFKSERGLQGIPVSNFSFVTLFKFICFTLLQPFKVFDLLKLAFSKQKMSWKGIIRNIIAVVRSIEIFLDLKKIQPDIVHLFWGHYPSLVGYLILKYVKEVKVSTFLGAHDLVSEYYPSTLVANQSSAVFTHSHVNVKHIRDMGIHNAELHVIYRGTPLPDKTSLISDIKCKGDTYATVSRLIPEKNIEQVIYAFFEIWKNKPVSKLIIMGDGPCLEGLINLVTRLDICGSVEFTGHVRHDIIFSNLVKTKFFLFPSTYRGDRLPNVIKEAMVRGCICISARTHGIEELIKDNTGVIFDDDFINNAVKFIGSLSVKEFDLRSNNSVLVIENEFSLSSSMDKYIKIWLSLVKDA